LDDDLRGVAARLLSCGRAASALGEKGCVAVDLRALRRAVGILAASLLCWGGGESV
jgi:hypothetical protein